MKIEALDNRYDRLIQRMPALIVELDPKGTIRYVKGAITQITGYHPEELVGESFAGVFFPGDLRIQTEQFMNRLLSGDVQNYELELATRTGGRLILEFTTANEYSQDGSLLNIAGIGVDVTSRHSIQQELLTSLEELRVFQEEQRVTKEELRVQNEDLLAAQEKFNVERQRYREMFEFAPDAYLVTDERGVIQEANLAAASLLIVRQDFLVGKSLVLFVAQDQRRAFQNLLALLVKESKPRGWETVLVTRDGESIPVTAIVGAVRSESDRLDQAGKPASVTRLRWILHDVTNRKKTETQLTYQAFLLENINDAVIASDEKFVITAWNKAAEEIFGIGAGEALGRPAIELIRGDEDASALAEIQASLAETGRFYGEFRLQHQPGRELYVGIKITQLMDKAGRTAGYISASRDITRRREAEEALRKSETRLRAIFDAASLGILLMDLDGSLLAANPSFLEMLGYSAEELARMTHQEIIYSEDVAESLALFNAFIQGRSDHFRLEKRYLCKDGRPVWARVSLSLVVDSLGQPQFAIAMIENINDRKEMEAELAEVQRRLNDSVEAERLHLAQDLHDGPVQDLFGLTYKLENLRSMMGEKEESLQMLNSIQDELRQVIRVLRTKAGELRPPALAPFGLEKAIRSHAERFQQENGDLHVHLDLTPDGQRLPEWMRLALFRIYQHCMANIARHAQARNVYIRLGLGAEQVELWVEDDGCGFTVPQRWIELVRKGHLGLAGIAERAEGLGGSLKVESSPGQGTKLLVAAPYPK